MRAARTERSIYKRMQHLADLTKQVLIDGNIKRAGLFFNMAEKVLKGKNRAESSAVSSIFIFSVGRLLHMRSDLRKQILPQLPDGLRAEYCRQVGSCSI